MKITVDEIDSCGSESVPTKTHIHVRLRKNWNNLDDKKDKMSCVHNLSDIQRF